MAMTFQGVNAQQYLEENIRKCADCDGKDVAWCDLRFGCFLCVECAIIHKYMIEGDEEQVKSFQCDNWTEEELGRAVGNEIADNLEDCRPEFYLKPVLESLYIIKSEYIQDKYVRKLFSSESKTDPYCGFKEFKSGFLYKKSKINECWKQRHFEIKEEVLQYFTRRETTQPKAVLQLAATNISIQTVPGKPYVIAISHTPHDEMTRTYYVYGETPRETIEWYYAILASQQNLAKECSELTRSKEHVKTGYMFKTGPRVKDKWRKRWVKISNNKVQYFEDETSAFPKGEFDLNSADSYSVEDGCSEHKVPAPTKFVFTIRTPERAYKFCVADQDEKISWMQCIDRIIA
ncbi:hypothetical protein LOD99_10223 [Oopsacas minuta]|uniref:Uncharacterized protein n=1 Tax=Oopsacas minuta TaxID=111878 RepID=A0AAV7KJ68_9METZ|nr:hypothetical protein LOD99_10223 [Oopsacas minuta]